MSDKRYLTCNLTGELNSLSEELYTKKILLYGGEENLKNFFIKSNIITLFSKGYDVKESAKLLSFPYDEDRKDYYKELLKFYDNMNAKKKTTKSSGLSETDEEVKKFIEAWKTKIS